MNSVDRHLQQRLVVDRITGVHFGIYNSEEVTKLSAKEITKPAAIDLLDRPVRGGLYDPALGPCDDATACDTCSLFRNECPGHCGHISLFLPVYNPLSFGALLALLGATCFSCEQFRASGADKRCLLAQLALLDRGDLAGAHALWLRAHGSGGDTKSASGERLALLELLEEMGIDLSRGVDAALAERAASVSPTYHVSKYRQLLLQDFVRDCRHQRCDVCGFNNPRVFRDKSNSKVFLHPLSAAASRRNNRAKRTMSDVFSAKAAAATSTELAKKRKKRDSVADDENEEEDEDDDEQSSDHDGGKKLAVQGDASDNEAAGAKHHESSDSSDSDSDDGGEGSGDAEGDGDNDDGDDGSDGDDDDDTRNVKVADRSTSHSIVFLTASEVERHTARVFAAEADLCAQIYGAHGTGKASADMFFVHHLLVTPSKFRPAERDGPSASSAFDSPTVIHPATHVYLQILKLNNALRLAVQSKYFGSAEAEQDAAGSNSSSTSLPSGGQAPKASGSEQAALGRVDVVRQWTQLQYHVNVLLTGAPRLFPMFKGVLPVMKGKQGIMRMNMMGKRVNYCARSVISPDPFLATNEVGIPPEIASRLSYPVRVNAYNVEEMQQCVERGSSGGNGANLVIDSSGHRLNLAGAKFRGAKHKELSSVADTLRKQPDDAPAIVERQLRDGDYVLLNRQPTLHKQSIMAHKVRLLRCGGRVIRMHYANCNTYNADFDGDEMNIHLPRDSISRAEAKVLADADLQYCVPRDGTPIRGLIQDHIVGAVMLTCKDALVTRSEACHMIWQALGNDRSGSGDGEHIVKLPPPTVSVRGERGGSWWSGKAIVSVILKAILSSNSGVADGAIGFNMQRSTRTPAETFSAFPDEATVVVAGGDLVQGVLDRGALGTTKHSLIHAVDDLYGGHVSGRLLSAFSRLFTCYLQQVGFTCGVDDMLLTAAGNKERLELTKVAEAAATATTTKFAVSIIDKHGGGAAAAATTTGEEDGDGGDVAAAGGVAAEAAARHLLQRAVDVRHGEGDSGDTGALLAALDATMRAEMSTHTTRIIQACMRHTMKRFPWNNMSMMVTTGAKGSGVNQSQISALLGQQELEGRRVPITASGRTLPCFPPWSARAEAGGYIAQRFLTGVKPAQYYFHCMAGREGLVDTAVKTATSGYLQRCLIKHLEGIAVAYDGTVRDGTSAGGRDGSGSGGGSIIQFVYGEDGVDVARSSYLTELAFNDQNRQPLTAKVGASAGAALANTRKSVRKAAKALKKEAKAERKDEKRRGYGKGARVSAVDTLQARLNPAAHLGSVSEQFDELVQTYIDGDDGDSSKQFEQLMQLKYIRALAEPGEAVGVVAAQSIGEPSTQMTLNTFHLAGHGDVNVTLGIPRLREVLLTSGANIKTPSMTVPLLGKNDGKAVADQLSRVTVNDLIDYVDVAERVVRVGEDFCRMYEAELVLFANAHVDDESIVSVQRAFERRLRAAARRAEKPQATRSTGQRWVAKGASADPAVAVASNVAGELDDTHTSTNDPQSRSEQPPASKRAKKADKREPTDSLSAESASATSSLSSSSSSSSASSSEPDPRDSAAETATQTNASGSNPADATVSGSGARKRATSARAAAIAKKKKDGHRLKTAVDFNVEDGSISVSMRVAVNVRLNVPSIIQEAASATTVREVPHVTKAVVASGGCVKTEGINLHGVWQLPSSIAAIDLSRLSCNSARHMLDVYGIEAARNVLLQEIRGVFSAYGIRVDYRHLSLVTDYMTYDGTLRAFNRGFLDADPSPLLKLSFEGTAVVLRKAAVHGESDALENPSSRLVIGRPVNVGTGYSFDVRSGAVDSEVPESSATDDDDEDDVDTMDVDNDE